MICQATCGCIYVTLFCFVFGFLKHACQAPARQSHMRMLQRVCLTVHMLAAEQACCNCQVQQRQKEYEALHHGALQRLQQWKTQLLHQQGD